MALEERLAFPHLLPASDSDIGAFEFRLNPRQLRRMAADVGTATHLDIRRWKPRQVPGQERGLRRTPAALRRQIHPPPA